ncbi:MAG: RNA-binding S4 domain-containing protein [Alphaproteobacteria bacterium]|nr:MAG: RNA-binding S4 domain-containing protein [Alphaproteobacteria bacterium]
MPGPKRSGPENTGAADVAPGATPGASAGRIRLDKWLWHARFFKSRSLAAAECRARHVRINGNHVTKASATVAPGDILTFARGERIFTVRMLAPGERRGPAPEAQTLYEDLSPPPVKTGDAPETAPVAERDRGTGRPTKAERRATDKLRDWD